VLLSSLITEKAPDQASSLEQISAKC